MCTGTLPQLSIIDNDLFYLKNLTKKFCRKMKKSFYHKNARLFPTNPQKVHQNSRKCIQSPLESSTKHEIYFPPFSWGPFRPAWIRIHGPTPESRSEKLNTANSTSQQLKYLHFKLCISNNVIKNKNPTFYPWFFTVLVEKLQLCVSMLKGLKLFLVLQQKVINCIFVHFAWGNQVYHTA